MSALLAASAMLAALLAALAIGALFAFAVRQLARVEADEEGPAHSVRRGTGT